uniref:DUF295 domain-containing protein n=1 Tax=Oryza punctata TaxID=4537 RepID=A0A0E0MP69_ORYPU
MAAAVESPWPELPKDLIGEVLLRLPSLADRVRLRAVCRPWRAGAKRRGQALPLPPPLPWFALRDGGLVDLNGCPIRRVPALPEGVFACLAVDDMAFVVHDHGGCSLANPPVHRRRPLSPSLPTPCSEPWRIPNPTPRRAQWHLTRARLADIAFLNGRLYTLTMKEGLYVFVPSSGHMNVSSKFHHCIADDPEQLEINFKSDGFHVIIRYLAECDGRLLMVKRWMKVPSGARLGDEDRTYRFEVFEADLSTTPCQWRKVDRLGGHAIFLGSECTKFVRASKCVGGVQEDCIYFMHRIFDNPSKEYFGPCVDPLGDSGVYNIRNGEITPLLPEDVMAKLRLNRQFLTWFFPTDV